MKVLLAEDETDLQFITKMALEDAGYAVTTVGDGLELLECVKHTSFDVILLDVMMPRMDGLTAYQELQRNPETRTTPVIFLTAKPQASAEKVLSSANGYIQKPFDLLTLADDVCRLLQLRHGG